MTTRSRHISVSDRRAGLTAANALLDDHVAQHLVKPLTRWCQMTLSRTSWWTSRYRLTKEMCLELGLAHPAYRDPFS